MAECTSLGNHALYVTMSVGIIKTRQDLQGLQGEGFVDAI